jgi:hypothetical protein
MRARRGNIYIYLKSIFSFSSVHLKSILSSDSLVFFSISTFVLALGQKCFTSAVVIYILAKS